jgi:hypothetical protein
MFVHYEFFSVNFESLKYINMLFMLVAEVFLASLLVWVSPEHRLASGQ